VAGLLASQGDVTNNVPVEELSRFDNHPRIRAEKVEGVRMYFLAMNVTHKPFDNKLVRQAINYAVDPAVIIKHIYEGNGYVMNGPMGSNVIGFDPKIKRYPLDVNKAKELLTRRVFQRLGGEAVFFAGPLSQGEGSVSGDCRPIGQGRHQGGIGLAGVRHLLGQRRGERR
jgi:peptide/nickel transport system substrate-binding protein